MPPSVIAYQALVKVEMMSDRQKVTKLIEGSIKYQSTATLHRSYIQVGPVKSSKESGVEWSTSFCAGGA